MQENAKEHCINCGEELTGKFCHKCGQKASVNRISIKTFFEDYVSRLFGMDTNFLRTLRDLTFRPGVVGRTFIQGNRVKYVGPVGYFFLMITLTILTFSLLDISIKEFMNQTGESMGGAVQSTSEIQNLILDKISKNLKTFRFLIIPFLALWGKVFYKKDKLNLFEHSVNTFYVLGHLNLLMFLNLALYKMFGMLIGPYFILISSLFFAWSTLDFYHTKNRIKGFIKGVIYYLVSMLTFMVTMGLVVYLVMKFIVE